MTDKKFLLMQGNAKEVLKSLPDNSIHTVITSPPYWQLRDYFVEGQLGREETPEQYVRNLVEICEEVKRVLRKDGTFWLNLGDSYNSSSGYKRASKEFKRKGRENGSEDKKQFKHPVIKPKDVVGIPWRVAFALQERGWYLRCDIIWKKWNPLPEGAKDRPTKAHEYIFLLSKAPQYFYDYYAVLEDTEEHPDEIQTFGARHQEGTFRHDQDRTFEHYGKRNKRTVWTTSVANYKGGHYAVFPISLIDPCVRASVSEYGCCVQCETPWERTYEKIKIPANNRKGYIIRLQHTGWKQKCKCDTTEVKPSKILDPFSGMATTGLAALDYNQNYIGIELNEKYLKESRARLATDIFTYEIKDFKKF